MSSGAVVRNLAVCSQPRAILASDGVEAAATGGRAGEDEVMVGQSLEDVCMRARAVACGEGASASRSVARGKGGRQYRISGVASKPL